MNHFGKSIPEKIRVFTVVESEAHFVEVSREMLRIDFMPRSHDTAFEQGECRLHSVGMNVAVRVLLRVIDRAVLAGIHVIQRPRIDRRFIGHNNFDVAANVRADNLLDRCRLRILGVDKAQIAVALANPDHNGLGGTRTPTTLLATNVGFVNLYRAGQLWLVRFLHRCANAMAKIPRRFVAHANGALDLAGRHSLLGFTEQRRCDEPLPQRQVGVVKDCPDRHAKLVVALIAVVLRAIGDGRSFRLAARALRAVFLAQLLQGFAALFIRAELLHQLN